MNKTGKSETVQKEDFSISSINDLQFLNTTQKVIDGLKNKKSKVKSSTKMFSPTFAPIGNLLYSLLPEYLNTKYNVDYDNTSYFFRNRKDLFENTVKKLKDLKKFKTVKPFLDKLYKFLENQDIDNYEKLIKLFKKQYYPILKDTDDKKTFLNFFKLVSDKKLNNKALSILLKNKLFLEDLNLVRAIKLIKHVSNKEEEKLSKSQKIINSKTKKLFGTTTPSFEQQKEISKSKPEEYKKWRLESNNLRSLGKAILVEAWRLKGFTVEDKDKAEDLLKDLKIPTTVDFKYVGALSPGDTDSVQFKYYTTKKVQLESVPGKNVTMNKDYDSKTDDTAYCSAIPASGSSSEIYAFYTLDYIRRRSDRLFTKARKAAEQIEDFRINSRKDLDSPSTPVKLNAALVLSIIDITAGRIGNPKSEKQENPTYGIHNLKAKHLKIVNDKAILTYIGKGAKSQKHTITDPKIVNILRDRKKKRKPEQYLFNVKPENKPVSPATIRKYLKDVGWQEANPHIFRKYHANKIFSEILEQDFKTKKSALTAFINKVEEIANMLGNTKAVAVSAYTSPTLIHSFFVKNDFDFEIDKVPAIVVSTLKKAGKI